VERHVGCLSFLESALLEMLTEAKPISLSIPMSSHDVPQETFRVLIGWVPEQWSVQARSSLISAPPEQHLQAVLACKAQVATRPPFTHTNPTIEIDENDLVRTIKARPEYAYVETEVTNAGGSCRLAMVNLEEVLAFQPLVRVDHLETRHVQDSLGDAQLYELCFPTSRPISTDEVTVEPDNNGYTITTLDPNIRMFPWHSIPGIPAGVNFQLQYPSASSPLEMQLFSFPLLRVPNYLQVVHYQDRYMLRNGYTRAADLLFQGIRMAPCLLIEAPNPALIGFKPGMFDLGTVLSIHPPRLPDFWDDTVTCLLKRPALRYVYHVDVTMMPVPR
jgi:hypothetical protein